MYRYMLPLIRGHMVRIMKIIYIYVMAEHAGNILGLLVPVFIALYLSPSATQCG